METAGRVLVTGGAGSFGRAWITDWLITAHRDSRLYVYSRDEAKHAALREAIADPRVRYLLGDVRDLDRLSYAADGKDTIIHAAALKRVPEGELHPDEYLKTNCDGTANVIRAALRAGVRRVLLLSTDKACAPVTLYGASKLCAERLIVAANALSPAGGTMFSATRYGNVSGSSGSVIPRWRAAVERGEPVEITSRTMTRFHMTQRQAVSLVRMALAEMRGGEVFIPDLPSYRLGDLLSVVVPLTHPVRETAPRAGEKMHESLISRDEARYAERFETGYRLLPPCPVRPLAHGVPVRDGFELRSDTAPMGLDALRLRLQEEA